jgi:THO complex subunit 2
MNPTVTLNATTNSTNSDRDAPPSSIPTRPEPLKNVSANTPRGRGDLPIRPDVPIPGKADLDRHRGGRRDNIPQRNEFSRDRHRDSSAPGRGIPDANGRDSGWERHGGDRDRFNNSRHGEPARDSRDNRDRAPLDTPRSTDLNGRLSREDPLKPASLQPERSGPMVNPERARFLDTGRTDNVDPARAALISPPFEPLKAGPPGGRPDSSSRDGRASRPHSPRGDRFRHHDRDNHDDRRGDRIPPPRSLPSEGPDHTRRGYNDPQKAPVGPREDRFNSRQSDRQRDPSTFMPNQPVSRPVDLDHGRLSQPARPLQDSSYGRLNPSPAPDTSSFSQSNSVPLADTPSGPRDSRDRQPRNTERGNRNLTGPQSRTEPRRQDPVPSPVTEKGPPTGPSSNRHTRRGGSGQFEPPPSGTMVAPLPPSSSPSTPVHPDRMRHLPQAGAPPPPAPPPGPPPGPAGVHPERMRGFQNDQQSPRQSLPAVQTNNLRSAPSAPSPLAAPPSGPRNGQLAPNTSSPGGMQTPTGPSGNDRGSRPNRSFAGLNSVLQQGGQTTPSDRSVSIKGRSTRASIGVDTPASAPSTPVVQSSAPREPVRETVPVHPERADLFASRATNLPEEPRPDSRMSGRGRESSGRHGRESRGSRRSSHDRSPRRDGGERRDRDRAPTEDEREHGGSSRGDPRERRGGGSVREGDRDRRAPHDAAAGPVNDVRPPREERRDDKGGRNGGPPRGNDPNWGGVDTRDRRSGDVHNMRDGPRGGDNRRESREAARDDGGGSGRKRRSEDAAGMDNRGGDKRVRR